MLETGSGCVKKALGIATMALLPLAGYVPQAVASDADNYPNRPIRLVVPYATGGVSDVIGRVLADAMTQALGQSVVVENRGGAGGTIGAAVVAKAVPDGYTLLVATPPMVAVAPVVLPSLPYDSVEDFTPIGTFVTTPNILVVSPSLPVKTMAELIAYAKSGAKVSYASAGPGSTGHLSGHILTSTEKIEMVHVPYKSSAAAFPDVISGRVSMVFDSVPSTIGFVRSGQVRPIAVMSENRSGALPDVPTAAEQGFSTSIPMYWMAIEGPPKLPKAIVEKLNAALKKAMALPAARERFATLGAEPLVGSPADYDALRRKDIGRLGQLAKEMGLRSE